MPAQRFRLFCIQPVCEIYKQLGADASRIRPSMSKKSVYGVLFRSLRRFPLGPLGLPGGKQRKEALHSKARIRRTCRRIRISFGGPRPSKPPGRFLNSLGRMHRASAPNHDRFAYFRLCSPAKRLIYSAPCSVRPTSMLRMTWPDVTRMASLIPVSGSRSLSISPRGSPME